MAELLIKATNATHSDPEKDARGCWKRGDIVVVMPDGHEWGGEERLPKFVVVKIPGVDAERARKYIEHYAAARRRYRIRVDDVPNAIRNQLRDTGQVTVTWNQVRNFIRDKATGLDESSAAAP